MTTLERECEAIRAVEPALRVLESDVSEFLSRNRVQDQPQVGARWLRKETGRCWHRVKAQGGDAYRTRCGLTVADEGCETRETRPARFVCRGCGGPRRVATGARPGSSARVDDQGQLVEEK